MKKNFLVYIFMALAVLFLDVNVVLSQPQPQVSAVDLFKEGLSLYKQKKLKDAIKKFESAVFFEPGMEHALYGAGLCHLLNGNIREAVKYEKNLILLQSKFAKKLTEAINKKLPENSSDRVPGNLSQTMMNSVPVASTDSNGGNLSSVEVPSEGETLDKVGDAANRLIKEQEENGDDYDCAASRQAVADGIVAFFEKNENKTSISMKDIEKMIARAGTEKEEPDESEGVSYSELNGKKVRMYKNRTVKLWVDPLIPEKLVCPLGGTYIVEQDGRTFNVTCSKHDGPAGTVEAPENCEPSKTSTFFSEFLIPDSY